ncbi:hypothetical protein [Lihuaxuella thermophila]|uniref:Uncharacterized protein n=1 Tax=Lihuaxuella thermophila TaxID=1173111 RepID=A0A1H8EMS7_9BACL|nr:hypothetical protein [Lihuaxuella thermophila]SEN20785.1 hypothetical protein SAMN05444955_10775 [Lihuaxuella thermophila]
MLTLRIEGPRSEVHAFIQDVKNNPQTRVIAQSMPYMEEVLEGQNVTSYCQLQYHSLEKMGKSMVVTLETKEGENLIFSLEYGKVIRVGNIFQITGKIVTFLPKISSR